MHHASCIIVRPGLVDFVRGGWPTMQIPEPENPCQASPSTCERNRGVASSECYPPGAVFPKD